MSETQGSLRGPGRFAPKGQYRLIENVDWICDGATTMTSSDLHELIMYADKRVSEEKSLDIKIYNDRGESVYSRYS